MIDEMTRPHDGGRRGVTVQQLKTYLDGMPKDMIVVVEGGRLVNPHIIVDVLPPEDSENEEDIEHAAHNTVLLTVGGEWEYTPLESAE